MALHRNRKTKKAYSILEVIVSLTIMAFAMVTMINFLILSLQISIASLARSFIREELSDVSGLISRDVRNADIIINCGTTTPSTSCEFIENGDHFRWEPCSTDNTRICKTQIIGSQTSNVFTSAASLKLNSMSFISGYVGNLTNQSNFNVILTISVSHNVASYNVNNVIKQTSISTRNFN